MYGRNSLCMKITYCTVEGKINHKRFEKFPETTNLQTQMEKEYSSYSDQVNQLTDELQEMLEKLYTSLWKKLSLSLQSVITSHILENCKTTAELQVCQVKLYTIWYFFGNNVESMDDVRRAKQDALSLQDQLLLEANEYKTELDGIVRKVAGMLPITAMGSTFYPTQDFNNSANITDPSIDGQEPLLPSKHLRKRTSYHKVLEQSVNSKRYDIFCLTNGNLICPNRSLLCSDDNKEYHKDLGRYYALWKSPEDTDKSVQENIKNRLTKGLQYGQLCFLPKDVEVPLAFRRNCIYDDTGFLGLTDVPYHLYQESDKAYCQNLNLIRKSRNARDICNEKLNNSTENLQESRRQYGELKRKLQAAERKNKELTATNNKLTAQLEAEKEKRRREKERIEKERQEKIDQAKLDKIEKDKIEQELIDQREQNETDLPSIKDFKWEEPKQIVSGSVPIRLEGRIVTSSSNHLRLPDTIRFENCEEFKKIKIDLCKGMVYAIFEEGLQRGLVACYVISVSSDGMTAVIELWLKKAFLYQNCKADIQTCATEILRQKYTTPKFVTESYLEDLTFKSITTMDEDV